MEELSEKLAEMLSEDNVLANTTRLAIMTLLYLKTKMKFTTLQKALNLTPGNLSSHLKKLEKKGYVEIRKGFINLRPTTVIFITKKGAEEVRKYVKKLGELAELIE